MTDVDAEATATYAGNSSSAGARFRILRPHARGGLGQISVALDKELHREVAFKELLEMHASDTLNRSRFVLEAEITGGLEHPGIVPVYGLGHYGDGRPFYAMRFVKGDSLKEAIAEFHAAEGHDRDPGERAVALQKLLRRFLDVCNAIEYAHSRGVLHRDLKPGNIMVGKYDETLVVDWGLAKVVGRTESTGQTGETTLRPDLAIGSAETVPGSVIGTPGYMSPEQAAGELARIGPASDVYSLGATLYVLLTGKPPLEGPDVCEVLRRAQAGAIPPPRQVNRKVPQALEAICQKAMALKPEDRYASPQALAHDLEHWLADEAVAARRDPALTRLARWGRRHKPLVASLIVLLATALTAASVGLVLINRERVQTAHQRELALQAENRAQNNFIKAKQSESEAEAVLEFFQKKVLGAARPKNQEGGLGIDVSLRAAIDAAEPSIAADLPDRPIVEAAIRDTLGTSYWHLGELPKAIQQQERALALRSANLGLNHPDTLMAMNNLATIYNDAGRLNESIALYEKLLIVYRVTRGANDLDLLIAMSNLADAYQAAGRLNESIDLAKESFERKKARLGPDDSETLVSMNNLASAYWMASQLDKALPLAEENLRRRKAKLPPAHPHLIDSMNNLGTIYQDAGRDADAIRLFEEVLKLHKLEQGLDHPKTLVTMANLANAYREAKRFKEAISFSEEALRLKKVKWGPDHPQTLISMNNLAATYRDAGRVEDAIPLYEETIRRRKAVLGSTHAYTLSTMNSLAQAYLMSSRWTKAETILRECLTLREKKQPDDWWRFQTMSQLGAALAGRKQHAEAESLLIQGYEGLKARGAKIPAPWKNNLTKAAALMVPFYEAWGKPDQAAAWRKRIGNEPPAAQKKS